MRFVDWKCFLRVAAVAGLAAFVAAPAWAQVSNRREPTLPAYEGSAGQDLAARKRPRVTIYPRNLPPNAKRICQSWLAAEYRVSGPVIVPQMRCRWE